jgi:hypothetical protein
MISIRSMTLPKRIADVEQRADTQRELSGKCYQRLHEQLRKGLKSPLPWLVVAATGFSLGAFGRGRWRKKASTRVRPPSSTSGQVFSLAIKILPTLLSAWSLRQRGTVKSAVRKVASVDA